MFSTLFRKNPESHAVVAHARDSKHPVSAKLSAQPVDAKADAYLAEYATLAREVGVVPPEMAIEVFKALLLHHDLPIYNLQEVVRYMDAKAAKESKEGAGWEWRPLRCKDAELCRGRMFGQQAQRLRTALNGTIIASVASDYYLGPESMVRNFVTIGRGVPEEYTSSGSSRPYDRTIPLHALRRVALLEKEYAGKVAFFVSDYALAPAIQYPDPFLLAVIPNPALDKGVGRFVLDFWDEPGFGIEQMLK